MSKSILAWHWLPQDRRLAYGIRALVEEGMVLEVGEPLELCNHGLHASKNILDAMWYAKGPIICRVELSGKFVFDQSKFCATRRKCLWMMDAKEVLRDYIVGRLNGIVEEYRLMPVVKDAIICRIRNLNGYLDIPESNEDGYNFMALAASSLDVIRRLRFVHDGISGLEMYHFQNDDIEDLIEKRYQEISRKEK
jgi:hypothetical protein